ncbi:DNA polymerase III subunit alpha [bacterium]|jgi:error-prone DNA polymerase|nr:DNA polymerase III subunit alpha [bacterium]
MLKICWHEWLCHTNFSFLIGASHPIELIQKAGEFNYSSLGISDFNGVYGIARAYREHLKLKKEGHALNLNLHYGAELHIRPDHDLPIYLQDTLVFYALTKKGYFNLCSLITSAHKHGKSNAYLTLEDILKHSCDDLAILQPMRGLIRHGTDASKQEVITRSRILKEHVKNRFYFVISRHLNPGEDVWISPTLDCIKQTGSKFLFSQDIFFDAPSKKPLSDLLHSIRTNIPINDITEHCFINSLRSPQSIDALHHCYSPLPNYQLGLKNSIELSNEFSFKLNQLTYNYPKEMIPNNMSPQDYLDSLTWSYAKDIYGKSIPSKIIETLEHELSLVNTLNFADYFLTVYDIVQWARKQSILCQGRGSAANSAICFVLGITSVNPLHFDLLFERFISVERGEPPDIDVDFEHERREEVIQYIYRRFGRDKAAMVCNVITFKSKGALRAAGKALGFPDEILSKAAKRLQTRQFRRQPFKETIDLVYDDVQTQINQFESTLSKKSEKKDSNGSSRLSSPFLWDLWSQMATQLVGFPRHLGIHSGGFVISDKSMNYICPQEPASMEGRTVIEWCKDDIEALGFFKIDILALGGLTMIRKCLSYIKDTYNESLSMSDIPSDDPKTYKMIQKADTVGTFQIESRAQMSFLPKHKPRNFYDLVVQVAIIRPGPIQGGMIHPYLNRRLGLEPVSFPDPRLEPILKRTYGVPIFQEQVMRVAIAVGDFTAGEANELRKSIGAFTLRSDPEFWVKKLELGMKKNKVPPAFIQSILGHIKGFASYGFPESHAASFAHLAYITSYLKCHYPAAFFAAILNSQPMGFYVPDTLIKTAQHTGVDVFPICSVYSDWDHKLEKQPNKKGVLTYGIRLGFRLIKGLSKKRISPWLIYKTNIYKQWLKKQPSSENHELSLESLIGESFLSRVDFTSLAAANVFHLFGLARKDSVWLAEASPFKHQLMSDFTLEETQSKGIFKKESEVEKMQLDYMSTTTSLGKHPTKLMKLYSWLYTYPKEKLVLSETINHFTNDRASITVFGMVVSRQAPPTAKGMVFISIWDETGAINLVCRPDVYSEYQEIIDSHAFLCISGICQKQDNTASILIKKVHLPSNGRILSYRKKIPSLLYEEMTTVRRYM